MSLRIFPLISLLVLMNTSCGSTTTITIQSECEPPGNQHETTCAEVLDGSYPKGTRYLVELKRDLDHQCTSEETQACFSEYLGLPVIRVAGSSSTPLLVIGRADLEELCRKWEDSIRWLERTGCPPPVG